MSNFEQLQIKLLSNSGELLRCVNCFAGQVTVMRGHTSTDLQPYQRALAGVPGPERLSLTVDGDTYSNEKAVLVGFGENFSGSVETCADYLKRFGVAAGAVDSTLVSFGLDGISNKPCSELSADKERRLRLLAALSQVGKIVVLNNPFEDVSSQWRERFAQFITQYARTHKAIVVIPSLTYRPECWIDNDSIARVQVGENLQRTIGFGGSPDQMKDMVSHMRDLMKDEEQVQKILKDQGAGGVLGERSSGLQSAKFERPKQVELPGEQSRATPARKAPESIPANTSASQTDAELDQTEVISAEKFAAIRGARSLTGRLSPRIITYSGLSLLLLFAALSYFSDSNSSSEPVDSKLALQQPEAAAPSQNMSSEPIKTNLAEQRTETLQVPAQQKESSDPESAQKKNDLIARLKSIGSSNPTPSVDVPDRSLEINPFPEQNPAGKAQKVAFAVELYPSEIRSAILASFDGKVSDSKPSSSVSRVNPEPKPEQKSSGSNLFSLLETTSGSGDDLPDSKRNLGGPSNPAAIFGNMASTPPGSLNGEDPEERRERIRQKFLEAIERAAAKRREEGGN